MTDSQPSIDYVLKSVAETRGKLDATETYWKALRRESRSLALTLILDYGYSVDKTHRLTGHHRNTLKVWVDREERERYVQANSGLAHHHDFPDL